MMLQNNHQIHINLQSLIKDTYKKMAATALINCSVIILLLSNFRNALKDKAQGQQEKMCNHQDFETYLAILILILFLEICFKGPREHKQ